MINDNKTTGKKNCVSLLIDWLYLDWNLYVVFFSLVILNLMTKFVQIDYANPLATHRMDCLRGGNGIENECDDKMEYCHQFILLLCWQWTFSIALIFINKSDIMNILCENQHGSGIILNNIKWKIWNDWSYFSLYALHTWSSRGFRHLQYWNRKFIHTVCVCGE